jgi:hypothetical protein
MNGACRVLLMIISFFNGAFSMQVHRVSFWVKLLKRVFFFFNVSIDPIHSPDRIVVHKKCQITGSSKKLSY